MPSASSVRLPPISGATATDRKLSIKPWERTLMFCTFIVMAAIEVSLLIDKPNARYFAVTVLAVGLILRGLVQERRAKKEAAAISERLPIQPEATQAITPLASSAGSPPTMPTPDRKSVV